MSGLNVTMVAFHGARKPEPLQTIIDLVCGEIARSVKSATDFVQYKPEQIHATLIGMEVDVENGRLFNHWFKKNKSGQRREVSTRKLQQVVRRFVSNDRLFYMRFGGFSEAYCHCQSEEVARSGWTCTSSGADFHSCDRSTYEGSFYGYSSGPAMITGWPVINTQELHQFPHSLYEFRRAAEDAGYLDKYHTDDRPHWKDDDLFLRVGTFADSLSRRYVAAIEASVRDRLAEHQPVAVSVGVRDVSVVLYECPSLEEKYIRGRVQLGEFLRDHSSVHRLYQRVMGEGNFE